MTEIRVRIVADITHPNRTDTSVERSVLLRVGDNPRFLGKETSEVIRDVESEVVQAIEAVHGKLPQEEPVNAMEEPNPGLVPVFVVFDGLPGNNGPHFVETEDADGKGIGIGDWAHHPGPNSLYRLGPFYVPASDIRRS